MNISRTMKSIIFFVLIGAGLLVTACAPSAEKLNNEGNDAFAKEAYLEALADYQSAQIESPDLAEPYYNAANALYREGAYPEALAQIQQALQFAAGNALAQNSFYNMGNSSFNSQDWQAAVDAYREALLLNPDDQEAKYNLELALQQLQQQQQQQQEQEQQEQEQEQEQQSQNGEGEENQEQQDQSQDGQEGDQEQQDQQQAENGEGDENQEQQDQSQEGQEQQDQNQDPQQQEEQSGQGQPQEGEENEGQPSQIPAPGQKMTEEQARQLLAAIAGDSDTLQERLGQMFVVPPIPPVQDW